MEDLKRLILPAIIALLLHVALIGLKLPKHSNLTPVPKRESSQIEITVLSVKEAVSKNQVEHIDTEVIPKTISQPPKAVQKETIKPFAIAPKERKKVVADPDRTRKEGGIKELDKDIDLHKEQSDKRLKNTIEMVPGSVVEKNLANAPGDKPAQEKKYGAESNKQAIPIYKQNQHPSYPEIARRRGYEGEILMNVLVDAKGLVADIKIVHSSGHLSLDKAALQSVKGWLFTPAIEGGRPVAMWVDVPIRFQLKE